MAHSNIKESLRYKDLGTPYWVVLIFSIGIFVGGFLTPPRGQIDKSLIVCVGLIMTFTCVVYAIVSDKHTSVSIDADDKKIELETKPSEQ